MNIVSIIPRPEDRLLACPGIASSLKAAGHSVEYTETADLEKLSDFDIYLGPAASSGDPLHEEIGRGIRSLLTGRGGVWWAWSLWTRVQRPNLLYSFGEEEMTDYRKELHRLQNRKIYERLLRGRAWEVSVSSSRFLWNSLPQDIYAEEIHESICQEGSWRLGPVRQIDPLNPLGTKTSSVE